MTDKINDGGPAFPTDYRHPDGTVINHFFGMSRRDWLAGQALAGLMANPNHSLRFDPDEDATYCVRVADAVLAALNGGAA